MTQQLAVRLSSAANVAPHALPVGCGSLIQAEGRAGRQSSETRKEDAYRGLLTPSSVDSGDGAEVNTMRVGKDTPVQGLGAPGPAVNITAIQASVQKGDLPPHGHRRTPCEQYPVTKAPVAVLSAAPARCGGSHRGLQPPPAGGGLSRVSPARTPIRQKKTAAGAFTPSTSVMSDANVSAIAWRPRRGWFGVNEKP